MGDAEWPDSMLSKTRHTRQPHKYDERLEMQSESWLKKSKKNAKVQAKDETKLLKHIG